MKIFPAIDLKDKKVVRLLLGDYDKVTVYGDDPLAQAKHFKLCGAQNLHVVDLDGAKSGNNPNFDIIKQLSEKSGLFLEVGGGIRDEERIRNYLSAGAGRVILGTAAAENPQFLAETVKKYGDIIAVGIDIKEGAVATHGWTKTSGISAFDFFDEIEKIGVSTVICTDISRDGAERGTNLDLYKELSEKFSMNIIASGGVSSITDIIELKKMNIYGAIIGKALYTGAIDLKEALMEAEE